MSWLSFKVHNKQAPARHGVELGILSQGELPPRMRIALGDDVLAEMGWELGERVDILRGHLGDDGMIALASSDAGWKIRHTGPEGRTAIIETTAVARDIGDGKPHQLIACKHHRGEITLADETKAAALVICLPAWARNGNGKAGAK